ncbi:MAG TPA: PAS domain-containing protein [Rhizomicrobium sp.]|nr:PAS domain-containing protein [Rhizomicrobium sp.]
MDDTRNPLTRKAYEIWNRTRGERPYPRREELPLRDLRDLLRYAVLFRVLDGGEDFEVRIMGDAIVVGLGRSFQGKTLHDVEAAIPGYGSALCKAYRYVIETREPIAFRGWYDRDPTKRAYFQESVVLPLGPENGPPDHLFAVIVYAQTAEAL